MPHQSRSSFPIHYSAFLSISCLLTLHYALEALCCQRDVTDRSELLHLKIPGVCFWERRMHLVSEARWHVKMWCLVFGLFGVTLSLVEYTLRLRRHIKRGAVPCAHHVFEAEERFSFLARLVTATSNWIIYKWKEQTAVHLRAFLKFDTLFFFVHFMKLYNPDWRVSSVFCILRMIRQMVLIVVN